jgi:hypothetical protein
LIVVLELQILHMFWEAEETSNTTVDFHYYATVSMLTTLQTVNELKELTHLCNIFALHVDVFDQICHDTTRM